MKIQTVALLTLLCLPTAFSHAATPEQINAYLNAFQADTAKTMNSHLPKFDSLNRPITRKTSVFSASDIMTGKFVTVKDNLRSKHCTIRNGARVCLDQVQQGRAGMGYSDDPADLVDNNTTLIKDLASLEKNKLTSAKLSVAPWSDDYWAIYRGVLGARFADLNFPNSENWKENYDYVSSSEHSLARILGLPNAQSAIETLSPSEKYDLLVGDKNGTLTKKMWEEGKEYFDIDGKVETWMGICHGWAPAAYMVPRPERKINVIAADGKTVIPFYPSEIKGLASLVWAKAQVPSKFIGGRCSDKEPKQDANGRILSDDCFDTNPGAWHTAVTNQIGVSKRSFVIDATFDYEVWNQPVLGYSYTYFNPITSKAVKTLAEATVDRAAFTKDKFLKYRDSNTQKIVGIAMDLTYVAENNPRQLSAESAINDVTRTVRYMYDLELNAKGEIIGGEWYSNSHPDFLWTPAKGAQATSIGDRFAIGAWDTTKPFPSAWSRAAIATADRTAMPLAKVIDALVAAAATSTLR